MCSFSFSFFSIYIFLFFFYIELFLFFQTNILAKEQQAHKRLDELASYVHTNFILLIRTLENGWSLYLVVKIKFKNIWRKKRKRIKINNHKDALRTESSQEEAQLVDKDLEWSTAYFIFALRDTRPYWWLRHTICIMSRSLVSYWLLRECQSANRMKIWCFLCLSHRISIGWNYQIGERREKETQRVKKLTFYFC